MSTPAKQATAILAPTVFADNKEYWDACNEKRLMLKRCKGCTEFHFFPRTICPFCGSAETAWEQSAGTGTIYTLSVTRVGPVPYAIAYVTLDEGVTMMTNIVNCDLDALRIGDRVKVSFLPSDGGPFVPVFSPVAAGA
jgi:uncharacterized OB-fold protein